MNPESRHARFHRMQLVIGAEGLNRLAATRVIIFGVGGVGSWTAEALVRSGVGHITLVDSDLVCTTNINRQIQATTATVGQPKVEALRERLISINPEADIIAEEVIYGRDTAGRFNLATYDYVIDAIDSLSSKVELLVNADAAGTTTFCSLGAACKLDASRIRVAALWDTHGCRLGRFVRKRLRKRNINSPFLCVYSDELLPGQEGEIGCGTGTCVCPRKKNANGEEEDAHEWCSAKQQINGSAVHITGIFGFMLCGLVIEDALQDLPDIRPLS